ncbi:hypothetical protein ACLOJK_001141 [Asimina triloba]
MSLLTTLHHPFLLPRNTSAFPRLIRPQKLNRHQSRSSPTAIKSLHKGHEQQQESKPTWENVLSTAASLYPVYVTVGGVVACVKPSAFSWFVKRGPASYSFSLGFIMLAMGLTLELRDLIGIFVQRPLSFVIVYLGIWGGGELVVSFIPVRIAQEFSSISDFNFLRFVLRAANMGGGTRNSAQVSDNVDRIFLSGA